MNELALFTGTGGGLLATRQLLGFKTVCYVEIDTYCIEVLKARIKDGYLDDAPIWDDVRTFDGKPWCGKVDIVTAGFPCQPWSVAGKQKGQADDRNLWPDTLRVIREVRSQFCFLENVPGLLAGTHGYFGHILRDLAESGYDGRWCVLSAAAVGAPHLRKRLWILAYTRCGNTQNVACPSTEISRSIETGGNYSKTGKEATCQSARSSEPNRPGVMANTQGEQGYGIFKRRISADFGSNGDTVPNPCLPGLEKRQGKQGNNGRQCQTIERGNRISWWDRDPADDPGATESQLGRMADGIPNRMDRLKAIGNAQVPEVARRAWMLLTQSESTQA